MTKRNPHLELDLLDLASQGVRASPPLQPPSGWLKAIRTALGMTRQQLADRMKVSASTIADLERGEERGTITLNSLRRAARAMGLEVGYAITPVRGTLNELLRNQAEMVARKRLARVHHTMKLEDQAVDRTVRDAQLKRTIDKLLEGSRRNLWRSN